MKRLARRTLFILAIDVTLVALCSMHIPAVINRAQAPFSVRDVQGRVLIDEIADSTACSDIHTGDELLLWRTTKPRTTDVVEYLADMSSIGEQIDLTLKRGALQFHSVVQLVQSYSLVYVIIIGCIGVITWCLGVFVLVSQPGNVVASTLHWAMISMAIAVVTAYEGTTPANPMPIVSRLLFFLSYAGTATTFLLFTLQFPRGTSGVSWKEGFLVFLPPAVVVAFMFYYNTRAFTDASPEVFLKYSFWFELLHGLLLVYVAGGIYNFIRSYIGAGTNLERKKLKWILWGLCVGPLPFLCLVIVPHEVGLHHVVAEEYALLPLVIIPVSFAVSFVRYQLLDIEVIIRRTTAYAIVIGSLLIVYVVLASAVASFIGDLTASAGTAILVALLFEPLRSSVQHVVDRKFFRVQYNFRQAEQHFIEIIKHCLTMLQLGDTMVREANSLLQVERIGFFVLRAPGSRLAVVAQAGFNLPEKDGPPLEIDQLKTGLLLPVACDDKVEPDIQHESADVDVFRRWDIALAMALLSQDSELLGALVLGNKKSGLRFSAEDIDVLRNACTQAALTIERITLQQKLFIEHEEREHLRMLNQLKSDFVSYVSHELRTPLTSIKMFAELLGRPRRKGAKKYVSVILGETDRLDRMVTTILDSAKIERDLKVYEFKKEDLGEMAKAALNIMSYQLESQGFRVEFLSRSERRRGSRRLPVRFPILADRDAVIQAITNLISNAIKYSGEKKHLRLSLERKGGHVLCRVHDKGIGISAAVRSHLFEKFYRDPAHSREISGVGLGLPLVKHIMDAHDGSVEVESTPGKGSTFTLSFSLMEANGVRLLKTTGPLRPSGG